MAFSKKQLEYSGKFFKELARQRGCNYSDMDEDCGFCRGTYSKFATGDRMPNVSQLVKIRDVYRFNLNYFIDDLIVLNG